MTTKATKSKNIERGYASFTADLSNGTITIRHGSDGNILYQIKNAQEGSWDKIWAAIRNIKSVELKRGNVL